MTLAIIDRSGNRPFPPRVSAVTESFWSGLNQGHFLLGKCGDCSRLSFPPGSFCPGCGSGNMKRHEATGRGVLYSLTTVHAGPPQLLADGPYSGAIIDLEEGVRLVTEWIGPATTPLDSPAELVVTRYEDGCLFAARSFAAQT